MFDAADLFPALSSPFYFCFEFCWLCFNSEKLRREQRSCLVGEREGKQIKVVEAENMCGGRV